MAKNNNQKGAIHFSFMNDKMVTCLCDPVKAKILFEVFEKKEVTTKQISEKHSQIPKATLYRHLSKMLADGILKVAGENQIRGTIEKIYALGFDFEENIQTMVKTNDGELYMQFFMQYMLGIMHEFLEYTSGTDINLAEDGTGFTITPVYATKDEITDALTKCSEIIRSLYHNEPNEQRQLHNICMITTPPKKQKKDSISSLERDK